MVLPARLLQLHYHPSTTPDTQQSVKGKSSGYQAGSVSSCWASQPCLKGSSHRVGHGGHSCGIQLSISLLSRLGYKMGQSSRFISLGIFWSMLEGKFGDGEDLCSTLPFTSFEDGTAPCFRNPALTVEQGRCHPLAQMGRERVFPSTNRRKQV